MRGGGGGRAAEQSIDVTMGSPPGAPRPWGVVWLPLAGFVMVAAEALFERPNPRWVLALFLWACLATVAAWLLSRGTAERALDALDRHARLLVVALVIAMALGFAAINVVQQRNFAFGAYPEDLAYYSQIFWNTFHGQFLSGNVQQDRLYHPPVSSELALHVSPAMLLTLLPLYGVLPYPLLLLIVRDVVLALAAWPLFLLARDRLGPAAGVAAVVLYAANAAVLAQGFGSFTLLHLAPLPIMWALYAFSRDRFGAYVGWTLLAMCVREDVGITLAGFGLVALVMRKPARWWLFGLIVPAGWWMTCMLVIQPAFGRWGNSALDVALAGGKAPLGAFSLLARPGWLLEGLRDGGLYYLYRVIREVAFLPVLGLDGLAALPSLASTLFLGRVYHGGTDPFSRFALLASCVLIGGAILTVDRLTAAWRHRRIWALGLLLLMPSVAIVAGIKDVVRARLVVYFENHDGAALREGIALIPPDAAVAAPTYVLPAIAHRPRLFCVQYLHEYTRAAVEYYLLDTNLDRVTKNPELRRRYVELLDGLRGPAGGTEVWRRGAYVLIRAR
jgi:hypothetical protein